MLMLKRISIIGILLIAFISCVGCGDASDTSVSDEPATQDILDTSEEQEEEIVYPEEENIPEGMIRLRTDISEEYRDVILKLGDYVDVPKRVGYTFDGYQDKNGVRYIDQNGKYILEYTGTDELVLWPIFMVDEYCIIICEENQPLKGFSKLICPYDENISDELPWGKEIKKNRKEEDFENYVIVGFATGDYKLNYSEKDNVIALKKLGDYVDHDEKTLSLNIVTTDISYIWQCLETRVINNKGFLKQSLNKDKAVHDKFSITKSIDVEQLKQIGYQNVNFSIDIAKDAGEGIPRVIVTSEKAVKEKDLKKSDSIVLVDTGKIKENSFNCNYIIPIDKITGEFYVYYNSETITNKTWDCNAITIELEFVK